MANVIHKLTRNKSPLRIFTNPKTPPNLPKSSPTFINRSNPVLLLNPNPTATDNDKSTQKFLFYPSFPFGYCLNSISSSGFDQLTTVDEQKVDTDDATTVWADSVKKKRKKKMNKHKYKKLRKCLRRKT